MCVNALGRGNLLKSLMTSQPTPLVGLKAVGRGSRPNGSSPSHSTSSGSERESQPTPGGAFLSRTSGAVSSGSDRERFLSPVGDVLSSRTLRQSPGSTVSTGSVGGSRLSTDGAVAQEPRSSQEASSVSAAVPDTSPVQSLIKSRLPKHLKSSILDTTPAAVSASFDFVIPNTNASNAPSLQKRSPVENSKTEVAMNRLDV